MRVDPWNRNLFFWRLIELFGEKSRLRKKAFFSFRDRSKSRRQWSRFGSEFTWLPLDKFMQSLGKLSHAFVQSSCYFGQIY